MKSIGTKCQQESLADLTGDLMDHNANDDVDSVNDYGTAAG